MPKNKNIKDDTDSIATYSLYFSKGLKNYILSYPQVLYQRLHISNSDVFDICIDSDNNIYLCKNFEVCVFCGKQSEEHICGKPICDSCLQKLKNREFDSEEIKNAEND